MPAPRAAVAPREVPPASTGRRRWRAAVVAIVAVGVGVSLLAGATWRHSVRHAERQAFATAATDVAESAEMLIGQDAGFVTSLRTALTQQPNLGASGFSRWFAEAPSRRPARRR